MNANGDPYTASLKARLNSIHHKTMNRAFADGQLKIVTDFKVLNRIGSPVYNPWENILPLISLILIAIGILLFQGMVFGIIALILSMLIFVTIVRPILANRLQLRTTIYMLASVENWLKIWTIGGVAIIRADRPSLGCVAPKGNWGVFAHEHLDDFSDDKPKEEEIEEEIEAVEEAAAAEIEELKPRLSAREKRAARRRR